MNREVQETLDYVNQGLRSRGLHFDTMESFVEYAENLLGRSDSTVLDLKRALSELSKLPPRSR